ncbi:alpha/beta hydrolase family protein [Planctomycetota bacterium]
MSTAFELLNSHDLPVRGDLHLPAGDGAFPLVITCHGFKGFKDWGWYPPMGDFLAAQGIAMIRFNYALNGVETDFLDFTNLENFGRNTFSREMDDLKTVFDAVTAGNIAGLENVEPDRITLVGHSRGGGNALVMGAEDDSIKNVVVLNAVANFQRSWTEDVREKWRRDGVIYITNARTKQEMPLYYSLYEDLEQNAARFDLCAQAARLSNRLTVIHATDDDAVPVAEGQKLADAAGIELMQIANAQHTFNIVHPFAGFTPEFLQVLEKILAVVQA